MATTPPTVDFEALQRQKKELIGLIHAHGNTLVPGDVWYVVAKAWWDKMEFYFNSPSEAEASVRHPGPVDNASIALAGYPTELKPSLDTEKDTEIVPVALWTKLSEWFGMKADQEPMPRQVTTRAPSKPAGADVGPQSAAADEAGDAVAAADAESETKTPTEDANLPEVALYHVVANVFVANETGQPTGEAKSCRLTRTTTSAVVAQLLCKELDIEVEDDVEEKPVLWFKRRDDEEWSVMLPNAKILDLPSVLELEAVMVETPFKGKYPVQARLQRSLAAFRSTLVAGARLDAKDKHNTWFESEVVSVSKPSMLGKWLASRKPVLAVHFRGWSERFDESFEQDSARLMPPYTMFPNWRSGVKVGSLVEVKRSKRWYLGEVIEMRPEAEPGKGAQLVVKGASEEFEAVVDLEGEQVTDAYTHNKRPKSAGPAPKFDSPWVRYCSFMAHKAARRQQQLRDRHTKHAVADPRRGVTVLSHGKPVALGSVGLRNLGNTCFMNSILQCLISCEPLTNYFRSDEFEAHINQHNPLGMQGKLVRCYAEFVRAAFGGQARSLEPSALKRLVATRAPQFSGYNQHDSQEFLSFLLDGLHEDVNRVQEKPITSAVEGGERPDEEVAREAWDTFKLRNQSFMVDHFFGQLRSHLTCPITWRSSLTFDPCSCFSIPVPDVSELASTMVLTYYPNGGAKPHLYRSQAPGQLQSRFTLLDVKRWLSDKLEVPLERLVIMQAVNDRLLPLFQSDERTRNTIMAEDAILVFEKPETPDGGDLLSIPTVHAFEGSDGRHVVRWPKSLCPLPGMVFVPAKGATNRRVWEAAVRLVQRYVAVDKLEKAEESVLVDGGDAAETKDADLDAGRATSNVSAISGHRTGRHGKDAKEADSKEADAGRRSLSGPLLFPPEAAPFRLFRGDPTKGDASVLTPIPLDDAPFEPLGPWLVMKPPHEGGDPRQVLPLETVIIGWDRSYRRFLKAEEMRAASEPKRPLVRPPASVTLHDCMEKFRELERLGEEDMWYSAFAKEHVRAWKRMDVWRFPEVLVIHLKRFHFSSFSSRYSYGAYSHHRSKITTHVEFPVEGLDLNEYQLDPDAPSAVYDLFGVSNHKGVAAGGHYTAYCRNFLDGCWYELDDQRVTPIGKSSVEKVVVTRSAYVLFYRRRPAAPETPADKGVGEEAEAASK